MFIIYWLSGLFIAFWLGGIFGKTIAELYHYKHGHFNLKYELYKKNRLEK